MRRGLPMRSTSPQRGDEEAAYRQLSNDVRRVHDGRCLLGEIIEKAPAESRRGWRCGRWQQGLHHLRKLSDAGAYVLRENVMPACNTCNRWVEDWPDEAHDLGLAIRPGDPGYELLGVRAARLAR